MITNDTELFVAACAGCRRRLGISRDRHAARSRIYCSELCVVEPVVVDNEEPVMRWVVASTHGAPTHRIAKEWARPAAYLYKALARAKSPVVAQLGWLSPPANPPTSTGHTPGGAA